MQTLKRGDQTNAILQHARSATFFKNSCGRAYAAIPDGTTRRACPVRSATFRDWLIAGFYKEYGFAPSEGALRRVTRSCEAFSRMAAKQSVGRRIAGSGSDPYRPGKITLDLGDGTGRAVEITSDGWNTTETPDCSFERTNNTEALEAPSDPVAIDALQNLLRLPDDAASKLHRWLVAALDPNGPHPILVIRGPSHSGKSTAAHLIRTLIDPNSAPLHQFPMTESKIRSLAKCTWVLAFDDIRRISPGVEKALKSLASLPGLAVRHADESYEALHRPIILVLDPGAALPQSLAIRAIEIELPALEQERSAIAIHRELKSIRAGLLATICTALSSKLRSAEAALSAQPHRPQVPTNQACAPVVPAAARDTATRDTATEMHQWNAPLFS